MFKNLLNQDIKPAIYAQAQVIENMITQKMVTLLNTQMISYNWNHDLLRQDNTRLHNQFQDLTRELQRTIVARTPRHGLQQEQYQAHPL